ncbi:hypothetical protein WN944_001325 [Citrus x changshan-huyou]|uniref:Uncharacterized protein n=1 Tax=Citrus x changshan-huyou TaxID=2935761 RepID=A0AAP0MEG5_9ROSI
MDKGKGLADEYFNKESIDYSGNEEDEDEDEWWEACSKEYFIVHPNNKKQVFQALVDKSVAWKRARKIKNNEYDLDVESVVKKIDPLEEKAKKREFKADARNDILARSIGKLATSAHMQGVGKFISPKIDKAKSLKKRQSPKKKKESPKQQVIVNFPKDKPGSPMKRQSLRKKKESPMKPHKKSRMALDCPRDKPCSPKKKTSPKKP